MRARVAAVGAAVLSVAALTALALLIRAGDPGGANWPATWELRSSDNGTLFQVLQDVFAGQTLAWTFSPQVYVFPELPISFVAFVVTGGNVYAYYLVVAVLNNCLLFLAIHLVLRLARPGDDSRATLTRAALATTPLVLFPLIGTSWLVSYHLAPTYYIGMYLMVLAAPALLLVHTWPARAVLGVAIALTAASNPLALVFAFPAFVVVLLLLGLRRGLRRMLRPAALVGVVLALALIVRFTLFAPLQGTSPFTYVDADVFAGRLSAIGPYFEYLAHDPGTRVIITLGAVLAVACLLGAGVLGARYLRRSQPASDRVLVGVYLGLVPLAGLAGTYLLMITHYLYFWIVLILPFTIALAAVPKNWATRLLPVAGVGILAAALVTGAIPNLAHVDRFFGYRNSETRCLDDNLPPGADLGYATFSDGRRISLTSTRPFRLIQIRPDGSAHNWLTNLSLLREDVGTFFYLNEHGDELAIDRGFLETAFGEADDEFSCGEGQTVLVYHDPTKLAAIARYYNFVAVDPARE